MPSLSAMRAVFSSAAVGPWTALVTSLFVGLARATGEPAWVRRGERLWARGLLRTWGVGVTVFGADRLASPGPYVVMSNHASHADVPILFAALPFVPGFLAKQELAKIPFLAMALHAGGHVLVDRSDRESGLQGVKAAANEVRAGKTVAVFPEGTRGDGAILPFKKGAFLIARRAGVPILPVGIRGSDAVLPPGALLPQASPVSVHIGDPIPAATAKGLSVNALCETVRVEIASLAALPLAPSPRSADERVPGVRELGVAGSPGQL